MKNLGFTLVELLGVIIIIGALVTIIAVSVGGVLDKSETKLTQVQIKKIEEAAKNYYISEGMDDSDFEESKFSHCVSVSYLIENGYIDANEVSNFETGKEMLGSVSITYNSKKYQYTYKEKKCNICTPVTEETKTTGNIPEGNYLPGDEYICEVKDNTEYHFFVLATEGDNVNLIMDRNMYYDSTNDVGRVATKGAKGIVGWYVYSSNLSGPVRAMKYLHNATKDWDNVPNIVMNYEDENIGYDIQQNGTTGYGSIKTEENVTKITKKDGTETTTYNNLKARMSRYDEVYGAGKCTTEEGSCPLWLSNYLNYSQYVTGEGLQNINGIYGYWTLSSCADSNFTAWCVRFFGNVYGHDEVYLDSLNVGNGHDYGVRPVISLNKNYFQEDRR